MNPDPELRCYALRRLNPFLGIIQVVETPSGRASSSNGLVWDIQILTQAPALLTLPYLNDSQRTRLESSLSDQAVSIEYHWRLYPKVLDKNKLVAARVKAGLQSNDDRISS